MILFERVKEILLAPAHTLETLAAVIGMSPEDLFCGESFEGVDLQDESIDLLLRLDADFEGAILTRAQTNALRVHGGVQAQRKRVDDLIAIQLMRRESMERYVGETFAKDRFDVAMEELWGPLEAGAVTPLEWSPETFTYVENSIRFISKERRSFSRDPQEAIMSFLLKVKMMRLPISSEVVDALVLAGADLTTNTIAQVIDFNYCTKSFVSGWLDHVGPSEKDHALPKGYGQGYGQSYGGIRIRPESKVKYLEDEYSEALRAAILGPTSPPIDYYESILERARSLSELRGLVGLFTSLRKDQRLVKLLARIMAQSTISEEDITDAALDERIDVRVKASFRSLILASGNPVGRPALLRTIIEDKEHASGIEVDSLLVGLSMEESIKLMRGFWRGLTMHHRSVALDAIASKASSEEDKSRVDRLRLEMAR